MWTFATKEDVIDIHPIPQSHLKDSWSDWVEALIRQYLNNPNLGKTETITDEYHDGDGTDVLMVKRPPIASVSSISVEKVALQPADYIVFRNYVQLKNRVFTEGTANVKISYVSGDTTIPVNVRMTAAAMIVAIANYRDMAGADSSYKWAEPDQEMGERSPNKNLGLTSHLTRIMKRMLERDNLKVR